MKKKLNAIKSCGTAMVFGIILQETSTAIVHTIECIGDLADILTEVLKSYKNRGSEASDLKVKTQEEFKFFQYLGKQRSSLESYEWLNTVT